MPGLNLVQDQQHPAFVAELPQTGKVLGTRDVNSTFALDRLDQHRGGLVVEGPGDGSEIVVRHVLEPGNHRLETHMVLGLGRRRQCGISPAVEAPFHCDDLEPALRMAICPGQLDRRLVGLGAAVAEEALAATSSLPSDRSESAWANTPWGSMYQVLGTWMSSRPGAEPPRRPVAGNGPAGCSPSPGKKSR